MRLSELLAGAHFSVAAGLAPCIEELDSETNTVTPDWVDRAEEPAGAVRHAAGHVPGLEEGDQVKASVLRLWDLFSKAEDGRIGKDEYEGFIMRVARVLLPRLSLEQERVLAANTWEEDAAGAGALAFTPFFTAVVRLAKMWTDSQAPAELCTFLDDLLARITRTSVTIAETGDVVEKERVFLVRFWSQDGMLDSTVPDCDFGVDIILNCRGTLPTLKLEAKFESNRAFASVGLHMCWFEERVCDPPEAAEPCNGTSLSWAPIDSVLPLGRAALMALRQAKSDAELGPLDIDTSALAPPPDTPLEGVRAVVCSLRASPANGADGTSGAIGASLSVEVPLSTSGPAVVVQGVEAVERSLRQDFGLRDLLAVGLEQPSGSNIIIVRPLRNSALYKLGAVRRGLQLDQPSAVQAALPSDLVDKHELLKLPTFTDVLKNEVAVDAGTGLVKPVRSESLLASGALSSLAEAFIVSAQSASPVAAVDGIITDSADSTVEPFRSAGKKFGGPGLMHNTPSSRSAAFTAHIPEQAEGLHNDETDLSCLAATSPMALWVIGQCDACGDYKTETCRRLAQKLGFQWLEPAYLLELAVKTPLGQRTPLMERCVEQLQRGLMVRTGDALRLTLEMMSSARCKTNGYILDFPPVRASEADEVAEFVEKVRQLSGLSEVRWEDVLKDDTELPDRMPDPEPPKVLQADGEPGDDNNADEQPGKVPGKERATQEDAAQADAGVEAVHEGASPADDKEGVSVQESADVAAGGEVVVEEHRSPPPPAPLVPNPLTNSMPRRVIVLTMEDDEVAKWRLTQLMLRHEERERQRRAQEEDGEEEEDEDVDDQGEEAEVLPPAEDELFEDKAAADLLATMAPYVQVPPLDPPKRLPPLVNQSKVIQREDEDKALLLAGQAVVLKTVHEKHQVPLLSLHADGRSPSALADLLEVVAGQFRGPRVPLPMPLEGEEDGAPKNLLRSGLEDDRQVTRRWSLWKQHCPVSLYGKALVPGRNEHAVEYAGYVLLFADEAKRRRFCSWPKLFLSKAPRIDAAGMHLGFALLSPSCHRCSELACRLKELYDFDTVDVAALLFEAMQAPPLDAEEQVGDRAQGAEDTGGESAEHLPAQHRGGLLATEKGAITRGESLGTETAVRLVARALGIERNLEIIQKQKAAIATAEQELEEAQAEERDPPPHIEVNSETGKPVIELEESLLLPSRGFLLLGFPGTVEQFESLRDQVGLQLECVLVLAPGEGAVEPPDVADLFAERGLDLASRLPPALETERGHFDELASTDGLRVAHVPIEEELEQQLIHIRKLIDPFYPVVDDESVGLEIPDPDSWEPEEAAGGGDSIEGGEPEVQERPVIPWGVCGPYCPVTLKDDFWLFPGQKVHQHVFGNKVYGLASEQASAAFVREPGRYLPRGREPALPPPRILITGPTGSNVARQCELLAQVYSIPVLSLEQEWSRRVSKRLEDAKASQERSKQTELSQQAMLDDDGGVSWPPRWVPEESGKGDEAGAQAAEDEIVDDGLDDDGRALLFTDAMRDVLGTHSGACVINGTFFNDLSDSEMDESTRVARSLHQLLIGSHRIPDLTIILRCKHDYAARQCLDVERIDQDYEEKREAYRKLCAEAEAEGNEPPDPPEDLHEEDDGDGMKESDRRKQAFIENKKAEQGVLKEFADELLAARAPLQKVSVDRGEQPAHKAVRWHCFPFMEYRSSLLTRHQTVKVSPPVSADMTRRAVGRQSKFGNASPMIVDAPLFSGRPDTTKHAVELRRRVYFPRSEADQLRLLERPADFIHLPIPSRVAIHPAVSICGPPLSGKTALAKQLAERTGAVYLTVPEVVSRLCSREALPSKLSNDIMRCMRRGEKIPNAMVIEALRHRMSEADVLSCGWILDDFPLREEQAKMLTAAGIVPQRLLVINAAEGLIFARAKESEQKLGGEGDAPGTVDLLQHEQALQRQRLDAFKRSLPPLRSYFALTFDNVRDIEAGRSVWATFDHALRETVASISERLQYYRRTAQGLAAKTFGMCFTSARIARGESLWRRYCPVALTLNNELIQCMDTRHVVEFRAKVYWLASAEHTRLFMDDPESFLQVPLPRAVPRLLAAISRRAPPQCQLEDYCPVALVDRRELVKASGHHIVQFEQKHYAFENKEARVKFMRRPERYVKRAELPNKKPALKNENAVSLLSVLSKGQDGRGIEPSDMLTYMQASVAEVICQGLVESGARRPLYPGKSAGESALLFLVRFLKAKNPINTAMRASELQGHFEEFLGDCALPQQLKNLSGRKDEHEDGVWTASDTQRFKELCDRFDEVFELSTHS